MAEPQADAVELLFHQALELPPERRETFLDAACAGDTVLRGEVESLLACDERMPSSIGMLDSPLIRSRENAPASFPLPDRIGHYRILRYLGEGGMGIVYEAEQDNPRRSVALKVIRPDVASPALLGRFAKEAAMLGRLRHPGIARIYEAGVAEDGRPFFAMELIEGTPLDEYARRCNVSPVARLSLLAKICEAVQHAHDQGIVHRDLKPANILVDADGQPKVLDFGVARAQHADLQTSGLRTQTGQWIGTPEYMSPEQMAGDPTAVDQRSDVYALGVLLYELMSGRRPHELARLPLSDVVRVISHEEPMRLGRANAALRGDVETIVCTALEKDKSRRYASAGELAADIGRHLRNEPILARPASAIYRMRKFARRRRAGVAGALAVLAALALGLSGVLWKNADAEQQAAKAEDTRDVLVNLLRTPQRDARGENITARQIVTDAEELIDDELTDQPELRAELVNVVQDVKRGIERRTPRAMILEVRGEVTLGSADGQTKPAVPQTLLNLDDRLTLSAGADVELVFLADLHQERLRPGREAIVDFAGCKPAAAVRERHNRILMTFVRLPKGTFYMGWETRKRKPGIRTEIREDFEIAVHEVTQGQWQAVMGNNPSSLSRAGNRREDVRDISDEELKLFPVESVSWDDVQAFLHKLNEGEHGRGYQYRLPTEAEWEYACRGGATSEAECSHAFYIDQPTDDLTSDRANFNGDSQNGAAPKGTYLRRPTRVGAYPSNRLGLCDMHGNVWEWCGDAFSGSTDRPGRGGGWLNGGSDCQAATRSRGAPDYRHSDLGFRLVRVAVPSAG